MSLQNLLFNSKAVIVSLILALSFNVGHTQTTITTIGSGTTGYYFYANPVANYYRSSHIQYIYYASTLTGAGMTGPRLIDSLAWDVASAPSSALPNYTIKMKLTSATSAGAADYDASGLTTVHTSTSYAAVTGFTDFLPFSTPFFWDGSSNILIDICWDLIPSYSASGYVYNSFVFLSYPNYVQGYYWDDDVSTCSSATVSSYYLQPNIKFAHRPAPACTSAVAGVLTAPLSVCPNKKFSMSSTATYGFTGLTYIWQFSTTSSTGPWTTMTGGTTSYTVTAGITTPTWYRMGVSCSGGTVSWTTAKQVLISPPYECYCIPSTYYSYYYIDTFRTYGALTNIENAGSGYGTKGYEFYSDDTLNIYHTMPFDFQLDFYYPTYNGGTKIWIDYNRDGDFFDPGEIVFNTTTDKASPHKGTITIPSTADTGITRMRVGFQMYSYSTGPSTPCPSTYTVYYGEYEDYAVNIQPLPVCSDDGLDFPDTTWAISTKDALCYSGDFDLNIDPIMPYASGYTYQWQSSTSATGPWTNIGTPATVAKKSMTGVSTSLYYRVIIYCSGNEKMTSQPVYVEAAHPNTPTLFSGQTCGPGPVTLTAADSSGFIYWYDVATGGDPLHKGDTFVTPWLDVTTTFYGESGAYPAQRYQIGEAKMASYYFYPGPFSQYYPQQTMQYLYTADDILASGAKPGTINTIAFNCGTKPSTVLNNYTVSMKLVPSTMTQLTSWQAGMTTVFGGPGYTFTVPGTGWVDMPLTTPFVWDGTSGIVIQICRLYSGSMYTGSGTHKYTKYDYYKGRYYNTYSTTPAISCNTPPYSYYNGYVPDVQFKFDGCVGERVAVEAYVRDTPYVYIPIEDSTYCLVNHLFTIPSAPAQPDTNTYMWSTGSTDSYIVVSDTGVNQYWVEVTTEYGCKASDTLNVTLWPSPEVDLGNDTLICEGAELELHPHDNDGVEWYWNTGETTHTIIVDNDGEYTVVVTNGYGCMTMDTIYVTVDGFFPYMDGIDVESIDPMTFKFKAHNPEFITSYTWDFGDGSPTVTAVSPTHTYATPGTYLVKCYVTSTCGALNYQTFTTVFTGIEDPDHTNRSLKLYPNPAKNIVTLETVGNVQMNQVTVINVLGQELKKMDLNKSEKYNLDITELPSGTYNIKIETNQGTMVKKFQIIR